MLSLPDPSETRFLASALAKDAEVPAERRRFMRSPLVSPALLVPVALDGADFSRGLSVEIEDIGRGGAAVVTERPPLGPHWALSLETPTSSVVLEIAIRDLRRRDDGRFRVACQFLRRLTQAA